MAESIPKYNFPVNGDDPFDPNSDNLYFVYSNGFSNLSGTRECFSLDVLGRNIDMGYKTISVLKRIAIVENGVLVRSFESAGENFSNTRYCLTADRKPNSLKSNWTTNMIYKPTSDNLYSKWKDRDVCFRYAIEQSLENNCKIIVSELLESISWH